MKSGVSRVQHADGAYLDGSPGKILLENEKDVVELIGICGENDIDRVLLHADNFPPCFFDLKSGVAGMVLQKFVNYHVKVAAVLSPDLVRGTFSEFVCETNRGNQFRVFFNRNEAERWLLND